MLWFLIILIFVCPFISSLAFPCLNFLYSAVFFVFLVSWLIYKGISRTKVSSLKYPLLFFFLALIMSVVLSSNQLNSIKELYKYIIGLLLFLITASLTDENKMRITHALVLAGLLISLLAIYQYFFGFQHISEYIAKSKITDPFILDYVARKRVFLPFVTPNILAGYLVMIIPLALCRKDKIFLIIPLIVALFLTKSLGAFLSLFLALGIYFYLSHTFRKRRGLEGILDIRKVFGLLGMLSIIALVFIIRSTAQKQYIQPVFSTIMRFNYWQDALRIIKTFPLRGVGIGNFNLAQSRYAHNSYLQIWAEMGILGIASFLWLIGSILKSALKNIKNSFHKQKAALLVTASIVFLIHNFVDFSFFLPEVAFIWWVILGLSSE